MGPARLGWTGFAYMIHTWLYLAWERSSGRPVNIFCLEFVKVFGINCQLDWDSVK